MGSVRQPLSATALLIAMVLTACTAKTPLYKEVALSEMQRWPEASYIDGQQGRLKWNYTTGLELKALLDCCEKDGSVPSLEYVKAWYDAVIDSTGAIGGGYKKSNYSLDHICPGRTLFGLIEFYPEEKYFKALDALYQQIKEQPRTPEGGFWHKKIYPDQMWLDGLYMAMPFYAQYTRDFIPDSLKAANYADIVHQFSLAYERCYDAVTGLLRHAWDSSHQMFWCDPATGQSKHAWGRALGWYCMALVDVIGIMDSETAAETGKENLETILLNVFEALKKYADPETGLWYQVLDCPEREGNYLEATCNAMFSYAFSKAVNLGIYDDAAYAGKLYEKMVAHFVSRDEQGLVSLNDCCEVAGLGGKQNRSGDYNYYIHEPVRANDPKGIGPLIWAAREYEFIIKR